MAEPLANLIVALCIQCTFSLYGHLHYHLNIIGFNILIRSNIPLGLDSVKVIKQKEYSTYPFL